MADNPDPRQLLISRLLDVARMVRDKFRLGEQTQTDVPGFADDVRALAEIVDRIDAETAPTKE